MKPQGAAKTQSPGQMLLDKLQQVGLVVRDDWEALPTNLRTEMMNHTNTDRLLVRLVNERLLTSFQADMIGAGKLYSLVLGSYRVLDRLGVGDMAVVFRAEHIQNRQEVAVKVLAPSFGDDQSAVLRFFAERKTVAQLRHPHIVNALDVGEQATPDPDQPKLYYYVMEHVAGQDLEAFVKKNGPLPAARACEIAFQVASALAEAYRRHLVHRDVQPANILITDDGKVKLLDFGLARQYSGRVTVPGTALGAMEYMAPEQASDASTVDIRADIYGLGATLFYCLTGQSHYHFLGARARDLSIRLTTPPVGPKSRRAEVPDKLDALVQKMLALKPADRPATPQDVMEALKAFVPPNSEVFELEIPPQPSSDKLPTIKPTTDGEQPPPHVLIVEPDQATREQCIHAVKEEGLTFDQAGSAKEATEAATAKPPDLILLADKLPDQPGLTLLRKLRQLAPSPHQKALMLIAGGQGSVKQVLAAGADDYVTKPLDIDQLQARLRTARDLKEAQDRADHLFRQLAAEKAAGPKVEEKKPSDKKFYKEKPPKPGFLKRLFGG